MMDELAGGKLYMNMRWHAALMPIENVRGPSLDNLIGADQHGLRDGEPKDLRGLQIDDQLELRGLLYREVIRLGTFQDPVYKECRTPVITSIARPTGRPLRRTPYSGTPPAAASLE